MIKRIRILLEVIFFAGILLMFMDFTGTLHYYLGWMAKLQFWPALTSATLVGAICSAIVIAVTLVFGRIYCSTVCPLGGLQDIVYGLRLRIRRAKSSYSKAKTRLRCAVLVVMVVLFPLGFSSILAPYSAFGRIANTLLRPLYIWGNNLLAGFAERADSYMFYRADVLFTGGITLVVAVVTLVFVGVLAAKNGRTYCNTICPVGTMLGFFARFSRLKMHIDADKCKNCGKCVRNCKASCIDLKNHRIDYSRCVVCGDCLEECAFSAMGYSARTKPQTPNLQPKTSSLQSPASSLTPHTSRTHDLTTSQTHTQPATSRRSFLLTMAMATTSAALAQGKKKVDGGLAAITDKEAPERHTPIVPPGAVSMKHMSMNCTACQLCVSACENKVLRPAASLDHFMQPVMSYEQGYCRPECHACSSVCPTGAIYDIGPAVKVSTKIGTAVFLHKNCVSLEGKAECGNCARHCPTGAITMVPSDPDDENSFRMPAVDESRCIGCGACEFVCPARPFSAIYVEGIEVQREV